MTYGVLTVSVRSVVLLNITDLIANYVGTVSLPISFEDLFFFDLIVFIVYLIHIYVNLYCVHSYMYTVHTVLHTHSNFILSGYSAGLVLIDRIMYSIATSMASD